MRVLVATPCFGGMVAERYMDSIIAMLAHQGWSRSTRFQLLRLSGEALITHARNRLAAAFMRSECDALFWVDADTEFAPSDVEALLVADREYVGGACPRKEFAADGGATFTILRDGDSTTNADVVQVRGVGLGFTLVRREVFETVEKSVDAYHDPLGITHDFFGPEIVDGRYYGEDYAFCARWRRAGGTVWAHLGVRIGHIGTHVFRGDPRAKT